jgi:WD40 repeat protein
VQLYNLSATGTLTTITNYSFPTTLVLYSQWQDLDFDYTGSYLACGFNYNAITPYALQVLLWDGISLTVTTSVNVAGDSVSALSWSPDGSLLAVGKAGAQALSLYSFNRTLKSLRSCFVKNIYLEA